MVGRLSLLPALPLAMMLASVPVAWAHGSSLRRTRWSYSAAFASDYEGFIVVVTEVVQLIRAGKVVEGREAQIGRAGPLADRLERLTNLEGFLAQRPEN